MLSALNTIHDWHAEVGQNLSIGDAKWIVGGDLCKCFLVIDANVNIVFHVNTSSHQNTFEACDAEILIINYKKSVLSMGLSVT